MFFLVKVKFGEGETPIPDYGPFETGPEAAKVAKQLEATLGVKVQPRRIKNAPDWRARAQARFDDGTWKPLPAKWDLPLVTDHYAHLTETSGGSRLIAFYEDETKGVIDRCTQLTAGRYINRYHANEVGSDERQRQLIAAIDPSGQLQFARTPDEIEHVYVNGPNSCMSGHKADVNGVNAVRAYGAGDLAVAYLMQGTRITARSVCWPDRKLYGRLYGDEDRLEALLQEEGFEQLEREDGQPFVGARLLKIPFGREDDPYNRTYILPYLDDFCGFTVEDDCLLSVHAEAFRKPDPQKRYVGSNGVETRLCPKMKFLAPAVGFVRVEGVEEEWSRPAADRHAFQCPITKKWWLMSEAVDMAHGSVWSKQAFAEQGYTDAKGRNMPLSYLEENGGGWRRDGTRVPSKAA